MASATNMSAALNPPRLSSPVPSAPTQEIEQILKKCKSLGEGGAVEW